MSSDRGGTLALPAPEGQGRCVTCRFWAELPQQDNRRPDRRHGQCRRYPPRDRAAGAGALWPVIQGRQWCGEHQPRITPTIERTHDSHERTEL